VIRERTFPWSGPHVTADSARGMASQDFMREIRDGTILSPPIAAGEIHDAKVGLYATASPTCLLFDLPAA
jgi:hypothetical protein